MLIYAESAAKFLHQTLNWKHFVCISFLMEVLKQISQINSWLACIASFMGNCEMNKIWCHMISCSSREISNLCAWSLFINVALMNEINKWILKLASGDKVNKKSFNWSFMSNPKFASALPKPSEKSNDERTKWMIQQKFISITFAGVASVLHLKCIMQTVAENIPANSVRIGRTGLATNVHVTLAGYGPSFVFVIL